VTGTAQAYDPAPAAAGGPGTGAPGARRPRLGFLGTGWIGRHRMEAIARSGHAAVVAVSDPSPDAARQAAEAARAAQGDGDGGAGGVRVVDSLDALLDLDLDGVVIATPSALHAAQAVRALERGVAVFCQKPLARTAAEARQVVDAARAADRLLGVDLSYRHTAGMRAVRDLVRGGELGRVYAVDLTFHNAYGPDKPWFYDPALAGGGCVIDLGIHLVDLALWALGWPAVEGAWARLYSKGRPLADAAGAVEDYAVAALDLAGGVSVRLACSWHLSAGQDAVIEAAFYGDAGGAAFRNVGGSFYDFAAERFRGTGREPVAPAGAGGAEAWGGRAAVAWAERLARSPAFDAEAERAVAVAAALDRIYGRDLR
jgi:predicted dehydrogenase